MTEKQTEAIAALRQVAQEIDEGDSCLGNDVVAKVRALCAPSEGRNAFGHPFPSVFDSARSMMATTAMRRGKWTFHIWFEECCSSVDDARGFLSEAAEHGTEKGFSVYPHCGPYTSTWPDRLA